MSATADFSQSNIGGVQAQGINGHPLENGNFIFIWRDGATWKMLLTKNDGTTIKDGYVVDPGTNWNKPNSWSVTRLRPTYYSLNNFKGSYQGLFYNYLRCKYLFQS